MNRDRKLRMIVLADTSVWIRFLSNRAPSAAELDRLLSRGEVSGHEFVESGTGEAASGGGLRQQNAKYCGWRAREMSGLS